MLEIIYGDHWDGVDLLCDVVNDILMEEARHIDNTYTYTKKQKEYHSTLRNFTHIPPVNVQESNNWRSPSTQHTAQERTLSPESAMKELMFCSAPLSSAKENNHKENMNITISTTNMT